MSDGYRFVDDEKAMLEAVFVHNPTPNLATMQELADKLAVSQKKVYNWFIHRRAKVEHNVTHIGLIQRK